MADYVQANAAGIQAAYTQDDLIEVTAAGAMVAYTENNVVKGIALGVQVAYLDFAMNLNRIFPVAPGQRLRQSQGVWKRSFPI